MKSAGQNDPRMAQRGRQSAVALHAWQEAVRLGTPVGWIRWPGCAARPQGHAASCVNRNSDLSRRQHTPQPKRRRQRARPSGVRQQVPAPGVHRPCAHLLRATDAQRVCRDGYRTARAHRPGRPRPPTCALPAQPADIAAGQPAQRRLIWPATPAISRRCAQIPVRGKHFWSPSYFAASCGGYVLK